MPISWNEIKERASRFSKEWENAYNEEAEAKPFLIEFLNVFGISQRKVSTFEHKVKKLDEHEGYIDLLWKGNLLIEMKSKGKNLDKALIQAKEYIDGLPQHEIPKYIIVSDFDIFRLIDIEDEKTIEFNLKELVKNIHLFGFIAGYQKRTYKEEDPVNIEAAELMGELHDKLKAIGYSGHSLERYLVRLLFCLFADDTSIFEKGIFQDYIELKTNPDGSDLAYHLAAIFNVLNTPKESRLKNIDESLSAFPYVNGKLFEETLPFASFDSGMRQTLLECCYLDWSKISPAIFGSLFQSVMDEKARRNLGAHYTSEKNILKLIKPLFLDNLWKEFESVKDNRIRLINFHDKISKYRFLDPACGCGNFLIIAYRELRLLEIEIVKILLFTHMKLRIEVAQEAKIDISSLIKIDVDKFYGIEYEEFSAQIAQVAMWLIDHQMNMKVSEIFGEYFVRLPLKKSATIKNGNALQTDWQSLIEPLPWEKEEPNFHFILGNPPFVGKHLQNENQKKDLELIFSGVKGAGVLDYVTAWYIKAAQYLKIFNFDKEEIKCAFVSTNSIVQGEQVGLIWNELFSKYHIKIHFAHRTFSWSNEAKGNAAVHVVIIGFSNFDISDKLIFEYENIKEEPHEIKVKNINPYLVSGNDTFIIKRRGCICKVPEVSRGSMPNDDGSFIIKGEEEYKIFIKSEPNSKKFIRKYTGSDDFINNRKRWCIWLKDANPNEIKNSPLILERVEKVRKYRSESKRIATNKLSQFPTLFAEIRQPNSDYLVIPSVSSERRKYIPIGYESKNTIANTDVLIISNTTFYHVGVLMSEMHMAWVRHVCGRLESRFRYSSEIVYNNFPWPENPTEKQITQIDKAAQHVLDVRKEFPNSSLADLYDPLTMPPALVKAHNTLDKAVDLAYRSQPFINETKRIEFLFELYDKYTAGLFVNPKKKKK